MLILDSKNKIIFDRNGLAMCGILVLSGAEVFAVPGYIALCFLLFALCFLPYALCPMLFAALCPMLFA